MAIGYFTRQALRSAKESLGVSVVCTLTIATVMLLLGGYAMAVQNLERLTLVWGRAASIAVYVAADVPEGGWEEVRTKVSGQAGVARATLVTPTQALERFRARGPEAQAITAGIEGAILPAAVEVELAPGFDELTAVGRVAGELSHLPGVDSVDYGAEELEQLRKLVQLLRTAGLLGALLAIAASFIVANTIKLAVFARRDEIAILRLVGATRGFVRTPFLLEGALWGFLGGLLAAAALWSADLFVAPELSRAVAAALGGLEIRLFADEVGLAVVGTGLLLGTVGSALAVRRFIDAVPT